MALKLAKLSTKRAFVCWCGHKLFRQRIDEISWPLFLAWAVLCNNLIFLGLSFQGCFLLLPFLFCLLFKDSLVLHEDNLLHQDSFVWVIDTVYSLVIFGKLSDSFSLHVQSNVGSFEVVFIFVVKFWSLLHGGDHHWVGDVVYLFFRFSARLYCLFKLFDCLSSWANQTSCRWLLTISSTWAYISLRNLTWLFLICSLRFFILNYLWRLRSDVNKPINRQSWNYVWSFIASSWVRSWLRPIALCRRIVIWQFQLRPISFVVDGLRSLIGWLDEKYLFNAHVVRVNISWADVFIEVKHFLDCLIQLVLVPEADILSRVPHVNDLILNLIKLPAHNIVMLIMHLRNVQKTFFNLFLVIQIYLALVLHVLHFPFDLSVFRSDPTLWILLFFKVFTPFLLNIWKIILHLFWILVKFLDHLCWNLKSLWSELGLVLVIRQATNHLSHLYHLLLQLIACKFNLLKLFKCAHFVATSSFHRLCFISYIMVSHI